MYPEDSCGRLTVWDVVMTSKNVCGDAKEDETLNLDLSSAPVGEYGSHTA